MNLTPEQFPYHTKIPVRWGDMDAFNHVNNTCFFRYMETSRIKFFEQTGLLTGMGNSGVGPILAETRCRFIQPLSYPDDLSVGVRVSKIGNSSFVMEHGIWSGKSGLAGEGTAVIVLINYKDGSKVPLDEATKAALNKFFIEAT